MWPFGKAFNSILVTDDETGFHQTYLYKLDTIDTYYDDYKDCIVIYRKDNSHKFIKSNKLVAYVIFEQQFKEKCLEDNTWFEKTIKHHAKQDLKTYYQELQFKTIVNQYKPYDLSMSDKISNMFKNLKFNYKTCFVIGVFFGYISSKLFGI